VPGYGGAGPWSSPPSAPPSDLLRTLSTVAMVLGLLVAVAPLASWFKISFGPLEASVNGWGHTQSDDFADDTSSDEVSSSSSSSEDDDFDWIIASLADGIPISLLGVGIAGWGLAARSKGRGRDLADPVHRGALRSLSTACLVVGLVGLGWVMWSWFRFDAKFDQEVRDQLGSDDFAAIFLGALDVEPGIGLIGAGLLAAGLAVTGFVGLRRTAPTPATVPTFPGPPPGTYPGTGPFGPGGF
jgi:hypothetical protein